MSGKLLKCCMLFCMIVALVTGGSFIARADAPVNDESATAMTISSLPFTDTRDTSQATLNYSDPYVYCVNGSPYPIEARNASVWYAFTPSRSMHIVANTFGSSYDTVLSVYLNSYSYMSSVGCNDNADSTTSQSKLVLDLQSGQTYYFMISTTGTSGGSLVFSVYEPSPLTIGMSIDPTAIVNTHTGMLLLSGTVTCSKPTQVGVSGTVQQRANRTTLITGSFSTYMLCPGPGVSVTWNAYTYQQTGPFNVGDVGVSVRDEANDPDFNAYIYGPTTVTTVKARHQ